MSNLEALTKLRKEELARLLILATKRNAEMERLLSAIRAEMEDMDTFKLDMGKAHFLKMAILAGTYESEADYDEQTQWITDERETAEDDEHKPDYPHNYPFFTEGFLYDIFGKEDARSILARFNAIQRLANEDDGELQRRQEQRERLVRTCQTIRYYEERRDTARKYLGAYDGEEEYKWYTPRKPREAYQEIYDKACEGILKSTADLAQSVLWHFEDN